MTLTSKQLAEKIVRALFSYAGPGRDDAEIVLNVLHDEHVWFMHAPERMDDPTFGQPVLPAFREVNDMAPTSKVIGQCPRDGREWECQCARCGASCYFADCDNCGGEGWIEDDDWQADEGEGWDCEWCLGQGGHWVCLSSVEFCEAHPGDGRADVKRGAIEWFTFDAPADAP